jgi:glutamate/tyrosine decarboxylase-like PLP-dependent enzyme
LAVARQWLGKQLGCNIALDGVSSSLKILTATPHSSAVKCLSMLGLGSKNFIKIKAPVERECIDIQDLIHNIEALNGQPFILISSGGTVNTVDFDDMATLAELKKKYNFWWHIDAAFGGFVTLNDDYKHLLDGWAAADSITIDGHKWLNVPYDSAFFFTRKEHAGLQIETFQNANAPYLGNPFDNFSYLNFAPENSRRFRALPTFFTLLAYGKNGYKKIIGENIRLAQRFGQLLTETNMFVLTAPVRVNVVCFTIKNRENDKMAIDNLLSALAKDAKVFVTPTFYNNQWCIRAAFVNWRTTEKDLTIAIESFKKALASLL